MTRYFVHAGEVRSKYDGDSHYINAKELAVLYGLNPFAKNVILINGSNKEAGTYYSNPDDIHLYPRYDGNYQKPPGA